MSDELVCCLKLENNEKVGCTNATLNPNSDNKLAPYSTQHLFVFFAVRQIKAPHYFCRIYISEACIVYYRVVLQFHTV